MWLLWWLVVVPVGGILLGTGNFLAVTWLAVEVVGRRSMEGKR